MKVTLVFYEPLSTNPRAGFGYASYRLATNLHEQGKLERVICRQAGPEIDLPRDRLEVMEWHPAYRLAPKVLHRVGKFVRGLQVRRLSEQMFDRFAADRLPDTGREGLVFATRPLVLKTFQRASQNGMTTWLFASVPHPLVNFALARNEELKQGLVPCSPITDLERVERLTRILVLADRIVTLGPDVGEYVYRTYADLCGEERLLPLREFCTFDPGDYAGLAVQRRERPTGPVTFFHVSHIHFVKGITYLLEAWRRFLQSGGQGCRLVVAGRIDPAVQVVIDRDFRDLKDVEYRGFAPELSPLLREADVFVSPSITDAGPVTIIEAMASGLPVIASNNCGFASLLRDRENGYRYRYNDVGALARIFAEIAEEPRRLKSMGARALADAGERSLSRYIDELTGLFESFPR